MKRILILMLIVMALVPLATVVAAQPAPPVTSPVVWTGQGTDSDIDCNDTNFGDDGGIHWIATGYDVSASNYTLTISVNGSEVEVAYPNPAAGSTGVAIHFYTEYYEFDNLGAVLTFDGTMDHNAKVVISHYCPSDDGNGGTQEIPEFPTIALPIAAVLGLAFFFQRRKE